MGSAEIFRERILLDSFSEIITRSRLAINACATANLILVSFCSNSSSLVVFAVIYVSQTEHNKMSIYHLVLFPIIEKKGNGIFFHDTNHKRTRQNTKQMNCAIIDVRHLK